MFALKRVVRFGSKRVITNAAISTYAAQLRCKVLPTLTTEVVPEEVRPAFASRPDYGLYGLGQPTSFSHPHLVKPHELVPGITQEEFIQRRKRLMVGLQIYARSFNDVFNGHTSRTHVVVLTAASKKYMSGKIPYVFRQDSDFYYLTGCLEPDSALMLTIDGSSNVESTLFMRPKDAHAELWDGPRTGPENATKLFGVNEAYDFDYFVQKISQRVHNLKPHLWFDLKSSELPSINAAMQNVAGISKTQLLPFYTFLQGMRLIKSNAEMQLMRQTCKIASESFNEVIANTRPGQSEHHLFAAIDYKCRMRNASFLAYPPVVAGGTNATIIHYVNNTQVLQPNELVLMDAGCEYAGYTSDITRTWPISGKFTEPQRVLYEMLLSLQNESIGLILQPGGETLDQLFESTCYKLGKYLQEIGLVPKDITDYKDLTSQGYKFCPHHVSHYLGMDVHDTPHVPRHTRLAPGMVFTVEPGIYISQNCMDVPPEFRGIGIRIEDDILINGSGEVEVLTAKCVKDRQELENLCKNAESKVDES